MIEWIDDWMNEFNVNEISNYDSQDKIGRMLELKWLS